MPYERNKVYKLDEPMDLTERFAEVVEHVACKTVAMGVRVGAGGVLEDALMVNIRFLKKFLGEAHIMATEKYKDGYWSYSNKRIGAHGSNPDKSQALMEFVESLPRCLYDLQNYQYLKNEEAGKELLAIACARDFKELFELVRIS